jgi:hypothetical protein
MRQTCRSRLCEHSPIRSPRRRSPLAATIFSHTTLNRRTHPSLSTTRQQGRTLHWARNGDPRLT